MPTAFDELAKKIPPGDMSKGSNPQMVTDYLGRSAPLSFSGQPALPSVAAPAPSTGPSGGPGAGGIGGGPSVVLKDAPGGGQVESVGDLGGGGGGVGPGEGAGGATQGESSFDFSAGLHGLGGVNLAHAVGINSPIDINLSPTGVLSPTFTGGTRGANSVVNSVFGTLASIFGVPHSLSLIGMLAGPAAGAALGPAGMVIAMPALIDTALRAMGVSTYSAQLESLSTQLQDPDPQVAEAALSQMQDIANQIAQQHGPLSNAAPGTSIGAGAGWGGSTALGSGFSIDSNGQISNALGQPTGQSLFGGGPKANAFEDAPPAAPDAPDATTGPPGEASGTGAPGAGATSGPSGDPGSPGEY